MRHVSPLRGFSGTTSRPEGEVAFLNAARICLNLVQEGLGVRGDSLDFADRLALSRLGARFGKRLTARRSRSSLWSVQMARIQHRGDHDRVPRRLRTERPLVANHQYRAIGTTTPARTDHRRERRSLRLSVVCDVLSGAISCATNAHLSRIIPIEIVERGGSEPLGSPCLKLRRSSTRWCERSWSSIYQEHSSHGPSCTMPHVV